MPVRRSYRRRSSSRRGYGGRSYARRPVAGSMRTVRRGGRTDLGMFSYGCPARKLIHFNPLVQSAPASRCFNTGSDAFTSVPGNAIVLNSIGQGSSLEQRLLHKIFMRSLLARIMVYPGQELTSVTQRTITCCIMLVYDTEPPDSNVAPISDILDSAEPLAMQRVDNRERFSILYRKSFALSAFPYGGSGGALTYTDDYPGGARLFELKISIGRQTTFKTADPSATYSAINKGSLVFYFISGMGPNGTAGVNTFMNGTFRLSFSDYE